MGLDFTSIENGTYLCPTLHVFHRMITKWGGEKHI